MSKVTNQYAILSGSQMTKVGKDIGVAFYSLGYERNYVKCGSIPGLIKMSTRWSCSHTLEFDSAESLTMFRMKHL